MHPYADVTRLNKWFSFTDFDQEKLKTSRLCSISQQSIWMKLTNLCQFFFLTVFFLIILLGKKTDKKSRNGTVVVRYLFNHCEGFLVIQSQEIHQHSQ